MYCWLAPWARTPAGCTRVGRLTRAAPRGRGETVAWLTVARLGEHGHAGRVDETSDQARVDSEHRRPAGVTDEQVRALGLLSEALETVEQARGNLYAFHQLSGRADLQLQDAVSALRDAGHDDVADALAGDLVGRNVLFGRWTYQIVEEYDDGYWARFRSHERRARDEIAQGRRHLLEAEMKARERSAGRSGHEAEPTTAG